LRGMHRVRAKPRRRRCGCWVPAPSFPKHWRRRNCSSATGRCRRRCIPSRASPSCGARRWALRGLARLGGKAEAPWIRATTAFVRGAGGCRERLREARWPISSGPGYAIRMSRWGPMGSGRSDTRERLRKFFEVDRHSITVAALHALGVRAGRGDEALWDQGGIQGRLAEVNGNSSWNNATGGFDPMWTLTALASYSRIGYG